MISSRLEQYKKKVFLCHQKASESFVRQLAERLKYNKVDAWGDYEDLKPGEDWEAKIKSEIATTDAIIVIISKLALDKETFFHKEIDLALERENKPASFQQEINIAVGAFEERSSNQHAFILPILIDREVQLYEPLKEYHQLRVYDFDDGNWFEQLLEALGIIKEQAIEFSLERQNTIVAIEQLKLELISCWEAQRNSQPSSKAYHQLEEKAANIVKYIDRNCEKLGERFQPALLYRKVKFDEMIRDGGTSLPTLSEVTFYPPHAVLVDRKYIGKHLYIVEKGGAPRYASPSKRVGQFEKDDIICGYAHFYSYQTEKSVIEIGRIYDLYDSHSDDYAIFIGSFKAK